VYLHNTTLRLINLDQNCIIKVFSIVEVLFRPPTLVDTIYGMNFEFVPELRWAHGYVVALVLMVLSAVVPYHWFKWRAGSSAYPSQRFASGLPSPLGPIASRRPRAPSSTIRAQHC